MAVGAVSTVDTDGAFGVVDVLDCHCCFVVLLFYRCFNSFLTQVSAVLLYDGPCPFRARWYGLPHWLSIDEQFFNIVADNVARDQEQDGKNQPMPRAGMALYPHQSVAPVVHQQHSNLARALDKEYHSRVQFTVKHTKRWLHQGHGGGAGPTTRDGVAEE